MVETVAFSKLDDFFRTKESFTHFMSPRGEEMMKIVYGAPNDIEIESEPVQPPSPNTSIQRAARYVLHEKDRKFVPHMESAKTPDQVYASIVTPMMQERNERAFQQTKEKSEPLTIEPYQKYWFTSESVQDVRKEIRNIRIDDKSHLVHMEEKFNDLVMNVIRVMKHEKMIDCQKTRKKLKERMTFFVNEVRKCRSEVFRRMLREEIIPYQNLNAAQKAEFIEFKPQDKNDTALTSMLTKAESIRSVEVDAKLIQQMNAASEQFPPSYQFTFERNNRMTKDLIENLPQRLKTASEALRPEIKPKFVQKSSSVLSTTALTTVAKPNTHKIRIISSQHASRRPRPLETKKLEQTMPKDIYQEFWNFSDPLEEKRVGPQIQPKKYFTQVTQSLEVSTGADIEQAAKLPDALDQFPDKQKTYVIESKEEEKVAQFNLPDESQTKTERKMDPKVTAVIIGCEKAPEKTQDDMEFLLTQTVELTNSTQGETLFERLNFIWSRLGFTAGQKLEMVAKYSQSSDESQKLADAVTFWENAEDVISRYQKTYRSLKDFLKFEIIPPINPRHPTLVTLQEELKMTSSAILTFAHQMKEAYGDDLIISRRRAVDVIPYREQKLRYLIESVVTQ